VECNDFLEDVWLYHGKELIWIQEYVNDKTLLMNGDQEYTHCENHRVFYHQEELHHVLKW